VTNVEGIRQQSKWAMYDFTLIIGIKVEKKGWAMFKSSCAKVDDGQEWVCSKRGASPRSACCSPGRSSCLGRQSYGRESGSGSMWMKPLESMNV
jgi:hypothetical protein